MNPARVAVVGGGVAGLSAAIHLVEIWAARHAAGRSSVPLDLTVFAQLAPDPNSEGSGLGGKAMSRSFAGRYDEAHDRMDRRTFYGPMMPDRGTVPHGYHILWAYPNLRRMLRQGREGDDIGGMLRPPGGAGTIASFQGNLDDPAPGGPGIGLVGLCDPDHPSTATRPASRDLLALRGTPLAGPFLWVFERLFEGATGGLDPFSFADLFYAHEIDLEMRLALIFASIAAHTMDPERETIEIDGEERPLWSVEYDTWAERIIGGWARGRALTAGTDPWMDARAAIGGLGDTLARIIERTSARGAVLESLLESRDLTLLRAFIPDSIEDRLAPALRLYVETERVIRDLPRALLSLGSGRYPIWRTLHFRFAPDATFASPYSFDAAQAVRSLAFCFDSPYAGRMWSADGGKIQRLWLRLWRNLEALAAATPDVKLTVHEARVAEITPALEIRWGGVLGHGFGPHGPQAAHDLGYPHQPSVRVDAPAPRDPRSLPVDACIPAVAPAMLAPILPGPQHAPARAQLAPLSALANETVEILVWTRVPIEWSAAARAGLSGAAITGLEGPFCLLADYRCGLWSEAALGEESPFGLEPFTGSILESCGSFADLYACLDRADAFGWPAATKEAIRRLLSDPAYFETVDRRARPHDEHSASAAVADGSWRSERMAAGPEDWFVAARWLAWGWLCQLAGIQALGPRAIAQLAALAALLDPRSQDRATILAPPSAVTEQIRYVVMRNANRRNRFFNPGVGDWPLRPVSGLPLDSAPGVFPAGDWTRNGLDVVCMEGACLSGMRAARGVHDRVTGEALPPKVPGLIRVLPRSAWYAGTDPMDRG